ncbi:MAG: response regulator transcription factor [Anaerolineae bacterium]|nr:response regulator transcription factor [Anaerolineae bacterium]
MAKLEGKLNAKENHALQPIRILLVDDHAIMRGGLRAIIGYENDMVVVGEAGDGDEAVRQYEVLRPDVVLMDLVMPKKDGIAAMNEIRAVYPQARILVLTSFAETDKILLAVRSGAQGYILKHAPPDELLAAIRDVYRGAISFQPAIARQIFESLAESPESEQNQDPLTERELEVLKLVAQGLTNDQIAQKLVISKRTVNVHIGNILAKLQLVNRAQMVLYALRKGLISLYHDAK